MSVAAVCVTYNRRDLVARCIEAVLAQTVPVSSLVVIDNASTDGTEELLRERGLLDRPAVRLVRLERNEGSAGGYAAGVAEARQAEADWLWLMDDDSEPAPDTLERLLASPAAADPGTAALCSAVVRVDGSVDLGHRGHFRGRARPLALHAYVPGTAPALDYFTFVGVLVRMTVARAADPPRADLFIWADDYEYSWRVREHGSIRLVPDSRMLHLDVGQAYSNRRSRFWNRLLGWSFVPTPVEGFWRNLCGVRNFVWIRKRYEGQGRLGAAFLIAQFVLKALLYDEKPLRRVPWIVRFGRDGRRGVFNTIRPEEWAEMVRRGEV
jgi:GT2 family glycosyltransferase